jgi:hypothetical protein
MTLDLEKISDSEHLLTTLVQMENVLDSLDVYSFAHYLDGEVVEGPIVSRYWVSFSLLYPYNLMPDPRAATRMLKAGIRVEFDRMQRDKDKNPEENPDHKPESPPEWLVRITIPRRLLDQINDVDLELYDDEVNADDVEDAQDSGIDDESTLHADEQDPNAMMAQPAAEQPPPDQQQPPASKPPR